MGKKRLTSKAKKRLSHLGMTWRKTRHSVKIVKKPKKRV